GYPCPLSDDGAEAADRRRHLSHRPGDVDAQPPDGLEAAFERLVQRRLVESALAAVPRDCHAIDGTLQLLEQPFAPPARSVESRTLVGEHACRPRGGDLGLLVPEPAAAHDQIAVRAVGSSGARDLNVRFGKRIAAGYPQRCAKPAGEFGRPAAVPTLAP